MQIYNLIPEFNCQYYVKPALTCIIGLIGICRELPARDILRALRDETMNDPRERIEMAQSHAFYRPSLLGKPLSSYSCILVEHKRRREEINSPSYGSFLIALGGLSAMLLACPSYRAFFSVVEFFVLLRCYIVEEITESINIICMAMLWITESCMPDLEELLVLLT